jgi:hypothetical protein
MKKGAVFLLELVTLFACLEKKKYFCQRKDKTIQIIEVKEVNEVKEVKGR